MHQASTTADLSSCRLCREEWEPGQDCKVPKSDTGFPEHGMHSSQSTLLHRQFRLLPYQPSSATCLPALAILGLRFRQTAWTSLLCSCLLGIMPMKAIHDGLSCLPAQTLDLEM